MQKKGKTNQEFLIQNYPPNTSVNSLHNKNKTLISSGCMVNIAMHRSHPNGFAGPNFKTDISLLSFFKCNFEEELCESAVCIPHQLSKLNPFHCTLRNKHAIYVWNHCTWSLRSLFIAVVLVGIPFSDFHLLDQTNCK